MKIGKKIIAGAMLSCGAAFSFSEVQAQTCVVPPSCEELGYSMSVTDCDGQRYIRCPLDVDNDNAVYCARACSCPVGFSPYNTCSGYTRSVKGECDNICYQCWDGLFTVELFFYCNYRFGEVYEAYYNFGDRTPCTTRYGYKQDVPAYPNYTEEELMALCPENGDSAVNNPTVPVGFNLQGYCNLDGKFYVQWPGK